MRIDLPYGRGERSFTVPADAHIDFLTPAETPALDDVEGALLSACRDPVETEPLDERVKSKGRVVVLVPDPTRSPATQQILPLFIQHLKALGIQSSNMKIIIAKGAHRKLTKEEKKFFKTGVIADVKVEEHDCDDASRLSALLLTTRGTPVRVNRSVKSADFIVLLSPVSFHYFAGFGGGRKLILPGCSDRASILANHRLSLIDAAPATLHPRCKGGVLEGNPVHEDMCEALQALSGVFGVNFFADNSGRITFINAGDPAGSHADACSAYADIGIYPVKEPYEILLLSSGGHPYDVNFLQSHKSLRHAAGAMKREGKILYFAECIEGVGSDSLEAALKIPREEFLGTAYKNYDLNNQTAVSLHDLTSKYEISMVSAVGGDALLSWGIHPCTNAEAFLAEAMEKTGSKRIAVMPSGYSTLPRFKIGGRR